MLRRRDDRMRAPALRDLFAVYGTDKGEAWKLIVIQAAP